MKQKHQIPDSKPKHEGRKVMHEPRKNLTGDSSATIMNDVQVEVSA